MFHAAEGWQKAQLRKLAHPVLQRATEGDAVAVLTLSGEHGLIPQSEYFGKQIAGNNFDRYFAISADDFVYNDRTTKQSFLGSIKRLKSCKRGIVSPIYKCFRFCPEQIPSFWEGYFDSKSHEDELFGLINEGARTGRFNISIDQFLSISVCSPPRDEQKKIGECLSSLDELITAEVQKLEILKAHKRGLMGRLFPAEGETIPTFRFPEFNGEWKERALEDFLVERVEPPTALLPLFSLTIEDGITPKTERYERSFLVKNEDSAYKVVRPGDFAYNPMNLRWGAIARHAGAEHVAVSKYYNIFFCDATMDSRFCESYFKTEAMIRYYDSMSTGSLIEKRRVHFGDFLKFKFYFPTLPEQKRIADCLSSVAEAIDVQAQKTKAVRNHKEALMQQLFPSRDGVQA